MVERCTYVMRDGKLVPKHMARPLDTQRRGPVSSLPRPHVISDSIGGLQGLVNPSDGKYYTSKAQMRAENRARGLTEVGNESFPVRQEASPEQVAKEVAQDIAEAYTALEGGAEVQPAKQTELVNPDIARGIDAAV
jgi:hypothetical protein